MLCTPTMVYIPYYGFSENNGDLEEYITLYNYTIWVCLKMLCTPKNPMVLLIIIPFWKMAISLGILTQHFQTIPHRNIEGSPWLHWIGVGILLLWETFGGFLRWFRWKGNEEVDKMRSFEWKRIFQTPMNGRVYVNLPEGKNSSDFIAICWRFIGIDSRCMGIY